MTSYVTNGVDTFTPSAVDGYDSARATGTLVHQILNRANPDITVRPATLRTGTLRMVFADTASTGGGLIVDDDGYVIEEDPYTVVGETDSKACEDAHAVGGVFSVASSDRSTIDMSYVASGHIRRSLSANRAYWILEVEFQEVET